MISSCAQRFHLNTSNGLVTIVQNTERIILTIVYSSSKMTAKRSSWSWANEKPVIFNDFDKATSSALEKLKIPDLEAKKTEDIIEEIVAGKRKRGNESPSKKKAKSLVQPKPISSTSLDSTNTLSNDDEEIEWSDGDELEMNKTLDLLISDQ